MSIKNRAKELFGSMPAEAWVVGATAPAEEDFVALTGLDRWNACVALAAQELEEENEALKTQLAEKDAEIEALKAEIEALKKAAQPEPVEKAEIEALKKAAQPEPVEKTVTVSFECDSHPYKGSRKAWAAVVELTANGNMKKDSRRFLDHCATRTEGSYRFKEYEEELAPGTVIETNSSGSKSSDNRSLWRVGGTGGLEFIR